MVSIIFITSFLYLQRLTYPESRALPRNTIVSLSFGTFLYHFPFPQSLDLLFISSSSSPSAFLYNSRDSKISFPNRLQSECSGNPLRSFSFRHFVPFYNHCRYIPGSLPQQTLYTLYLNISSLPFSLPKHLSFFLLQFFLYPLSIFISFTSFLDSLFFAALSLLSLINIQDLHKVSIKGYANVFPFHFVTLRSSLLLHKPDLFPLS